VPAPKNAKANTTARSGAATTSTPSARIMTAIPGTKIRGTCRVCQKYPGTSPFLQTIPPKGTVKREGELAPWGTQPVGLIARPANSRSAGHACTTLLAGRAGTDCEPASRRGGDDLQMGDQFGRIDSPGPASGESPFFLGLYKPNRPPPKGRPVGVRWILYSGLLQSQRCYTGHFRLPPSSGSM
jgi:hypothetical protein